MDIKEPQEENRKEPIPGEYGFPIPKELLFRELGFGGFTGFHSFPKYNAGKKVVSQSLATKAVHTLCTKDLSRRRFKLPNGARTTFHIAFSADGSKVASCHGDHNVYVCDVASGEVVQTLTGHPRTPWCVVFHPTQNDVLASGCLAGHVRVWDLKGGSELLVTDSGTVIASLAFHPTVRLLAIATFNEIIFWDWGHPYPMARCSTENTKEKVRLVRFDRLGRNLITGITNFPSPPPREEVRRPVRGGVPFFRPNILSRNYRGRRASPVYVPSPRADDVESMEDVQMVNENEVVEEVVVPDPEETEAEAFAVAAAAVAAEEDPLIVGETLNARQDRFQESYRQLVSHYEELVSNYQQFLRSRIPRILENSSASTIQQQAPPVDEPMSDEPMLPQVNPEVIVNHLEDGFETDPLPNPSSLNESSETEASRTTILESPASPVMDDEVPGPSRLVFESTPEPSAAESPDNSVAASSSSSSSSSNAENASTPPASTSGARSDTDLRSIEALAQNILEMQNLCSQVRMDAPLAVENQHIMELRVIRRHLELLQEQTRELQSSIRATLNSLATGSLAALRSHVANAAAAAAAANNSNASSNQESQVLENPFLVQATPPTPIGPGPVMDFENHSPPFSPLRDNAGESNAENPALVNAEIARRVRQYLPSTASRSSMSLPNPNPNASGPNTLYRIMIATPFTESNRLPNTPLFNRIRVPPMVAMQYELPETFPRNLAGSSRNIEEAVPGPSRDAATNNNSNSNSSNGRGRDSSGPGPRRIVREFHLVSGRPGTFVAEEHARHCPFSGRDPYHWRPPPRMRSLYDMGEMPPLITWPTMETGMESSIRNFRAVMPPVANNRPVRNPSFSGITITVRNGYGGPNSVSIHDISSNNNSNSSQGRNVPFMNFSQWLFTSGINVGSLTSDVLVGIYLSVRQVNNGDVATQSEQWQQVFGNIVPGLALIPPVLRQGQQQQRQQPQQMQHRCQHRRRRTHWICYNHNSSAHTNSRPCSISITRSNNNNNNQEDINHSSSNGGAPSSSRIPISNSRASAAAVSADSTSSSQTFSEQPTGSRNALSSSSATSKSGRPIPSLLERNFTRVFYIRAADELIPVYSTVNSSDNVIGNEVRESLQASVYYLPIGLFLQGGPWESNTQTIGIHWPPVTREEEYAVLDLRVSERPLNVHQSDTRESYPNNRRYPRIRIDYDQTSLRVTLPTGFSLHFIQSGLTLLDCISSSVSLPRPRAIEGTLWIDYLGPFLDALERMFGLRHQRRSIGSVPSGHRVGAYLGRTPPWVPAGNSRPSMFSPSPTPNNSATTPGDGSRQVSNSASSSSSNNNNTSNSNSGIPSGRDRPTPGSSRRSEVGERLRTMSRRIITLAPDAPVDTGRRRFYDESPMVSLMYDDGPGSSNGGYRSVFERNNDRRFYYRHRHRHDHGFMPPGSHQRDGSHPHDGPDGGRFIRLAVDTAASEVLRRNQSHGMDGLPESNNGLPIVEAGSASGFSTIGRPVESRIERVLNERGNRGAHHSPGPSGYLLDESSRNRMRLEEIQMRISMLSQWSRARAMATSGTQTPQSFVRTGWPNGERPSATAANSNSASGGSSSNHERPRDSQSGGSSAAGGSGSSRNGGSTSPSLIDPRLSRRRPYSRITRVVPNESEDNSDDDYHIVRLPRLSELASRSDRSDGSNANRGEPSRSSNRQSIDHWILRSVPPTSNPHRYHRPSTVVELSGSARTRAPLPSRLPVDNSDSVSSSSDAHQDGEAVSRLRFLRANRNGSYNPAGTANNDGNNNNNNSNNNIGNPGEEQYQDPGARFYPGYIPEILITPRTRPPTYYTMDAATTAFLSSRIQKWDFSEFLIPDITKRDEFVVVRECSLHSDACLDVSSDSEFLAVLQPSDGGSYSSVGIYSLRDDSLGEILSVYHFDQNTVSVSISPSCDYLVVGYAGRGPLYRFVHPSRGIGKILSLTRDEECFKLVHVKDLLADGQVAFMSINCMHWVPVAGYGIVYGTNTGDLVLLS